MKNPLKTLGVNHLGRDFVIGDLHGAYSVFENLLHNIGFDKTRDRMISVGDLVDRGPASVRCLQLIREPWFESVLANHEMMMLHRFFGGRSGPWWFGNGGNWGMEAYNDYVAVYVNGTREIPSDESYEIIDLLRFVEELPFLITVDTKSGKKFHIIHAEFSPTATVTDEILADPENVRRLATHPTMDGDVCLWGRYLFGMFNTVDMHVRGAEYVAQARSYGSTKTCFNDNLSHIISGHCIVRQPLTIQGQTDIDTGAYKSLYRPAMPYENIQSSPEPWAGLTCVELDTWKFYTATEHSFKEVVPYVINKEDM